MAEGPRIVVSSSARVRRAEALAWLAARGASEPVWVVGATLEGAVDLVREAARGRAAALGWKRTTLAKLAAELALGSLAQDGLAPVGALSMEALCARLVHELRGTGELGRLEKVAARPGLARALARTLGELRLEGIAADGLSRAQPELARILGRLDEALARERLADRAAIFARATEAVRGVATCPRVLLVDVPCATRRELEFVSALVQRGPSEEGLMAVVPAGDERSLRGLVAALPGATVRVQSASGPLGRAQDGLFAGRSDVAKESEAVSLFSAPGESREAVEIARRILAEAKAGRPFDRMAVLVRSLGAHRAAIEEAFERAGIPVFNARGGTRPDPAGRAFLALLACAAENLSATRFAEYLALGEVPGEVQDPAPEAPVSGAGWVPPEDELAPRAQLPEGGASTAGAAEEGAPRAPWRWEELIIDAAVIGGRERWSKRLEGLRKELLRREAALREEDAPAAERARRSAEQLSELTRFVLPLIDDLAALPTEATWSEWLEHLSQLATRALREPSRVLTLLAELQPLGPVGPLRIAEVRSVLARRLGELPQPPPTRRFGRVFVGPTESARGLSFDVVFVPGLAERLFPQKVVEDPLLPDGARRELGLPERAARVEHERVQLRLAVGAASERLVLSWARIDQQTSRPRVASFYGLEVLRAAEGALPGFDALARRAERATQARAGWPAPEDPRRAIDEAEYDLALLDRALRRPDARGAARHLMTTNPHLARALRSRYRRERDLWTQSDGLVNPRPEGLAALAAHQLAARSYSPTALQGYAACPYKFLLSAIHRLEPREVPEAIDAIDPRSRGSLLHEIQFLLLERLAAQGLLPLTGQTVPRAQKVLEPLIDEVAARFADELNPAIPRVWSDGVAAVRADLREWLRRLALEPRWVPWRFELSFGLADRSGHDPHSTVEPAALAGLRLRGSIDLVEREEGGALRATDHKTGKPWMSKGAVIAGGTILQPVLYALALEQLFPGQRVESGRLSYCTHGGGFSERTVPLDAQARGSIDVLVRALGNSLAEGSFPQAPLADGPRVECDRCDYLPVCGPGALARARAKDAAEKRQGRTPRLAALVQLRGCP